MGRIDVVIKKIKQVLCFHKWNRWVSKGKNKEKRICRKCFKEEYRNKIL